MYAGEVLRDFGLKLGWSEKYASLFFFFVHTPGEVLGSRRGAWLQQRCSGILVLSWDGLKNPRLFFVLPKASRRVLSRKESRD